MHIAEQRRRTLLKDFHDTWSSIATAKHQHLPPSFLPSSPPTFASFHDHPSVQSYWLLFASWHSLISFCLSPPLTPPIMLQGHRMARLYLPFPPPLLYPHLIYTFWLHFHRGYTCCSFSDLIVKVQFGCQKTVGMFLLVIKHLDTDMSS